MNVILLDFDHTLYPSTSPTLLHIDQRITLFLETRFGLDFAAADALRQSLCRGHGTTLRGLMLNHGIDPHGYCDFIHAVDDAILPSPDPALRAWLENLRWPAYVFTNARADWAERGLKAMGLWDLVGENRPLLGILDLPFTGWIGKPDPAAYLAVEDFIRARHGGPGAPPLTLHFADDRIDNLQAAALRGWRTHWVRPHHFPSSLGANDGDSASSARAGMSTIRSLLDLHPHDLSPLAAN